jgi:hypothetical protein
LRCKVGTSTFVTLGIRRFRVPITSIRRPG